MVCHLSYSTPPSAKPQVWPVIHLDTLQLAHSNADMAFRLSCAGVFVISMDGRNDKALHTAIALKAQHPQQNVGVNLLGVSALAALQLSLRSGLDATWSDAAGVSSRAVSDEAKAIGAVLRLHPEHAFFGSVAFKYQPDEPNPPAAAIAANTLGMIATTSGSATGSAPSAQKLRAIRDVLGKAPLAAASGITPDNAYELGRFLTHILVATGVAKSFHEFDEALLERLLGQLQDI